LLLIACLVPLMPAYAEPTQLHFAYAAGAGSLYEVSANEFAKRVNARLPSEYRVVPAGESRLGFDKEMLDKVKRGEVTMSLFSTIMSTVSNKFGIFELPFLIHDRAQIQRVGQPLLAQYLQP